MDLPHVERRLTAVLAADVVGYSRLMQSDDEATLRALTERRAVFADRVVADGGRVVDTAGDSVLAEFPSIFRAVQCAIAVQRGLEEANAPLAEDRRMRYRIGVELGDVLSDGQGIYGDGVNIAARLQGLAPPGGICVSQAVREQVGHRLALRFEDLGDQPVKNIAGPVRVFRIALEQDAEAASDAAHAPAAPHGERAWLAVLPFDNMSGESDQAYFADGMVEELITALARTEQFFVVARNSTFAYKGQAVDVKRVGRELGVNYVLEGSVRKAGARVRITVQLIDAASGAHLWADRFDGTLEEIFELQDRIAESVVWAILPSLQRAEIERSRAKGPRNVLAYDLLLRAMPGILPGASKVQKVEAMTLLQRAVELDPRYALAKACAAFVCLHRLTDGEGGADVARTGLRLADQALADHQDNPATLALAGMTVALLGYRMLGVPVIGFRYDDALSATDRALALSPNLFTVAYASGIVRACAGDAEAGIELLERAVRLSPRGPALAALLSALAATYAVCGRYEEGLAAAERAVRESPSFASAHRTLTGLLGSLGRWDEAKESARRLLALAPRFTVSRYASTVPIRDAGLRRQVCDLLRTAGVPD